MKHNKWTILYNHGNICLSKILTSLEKNNQNLQQQLN